MGLRGGNKVNQLKIVLSVRVLQSWALEGWRLDNRGWGEHTAVFTGTQLANAYLAFVPLLKTPDHTLLGKKHVKKVGT